MIQVPIKLKEIEILGHAEYASKGQDIVCASISIMVHNFIWYATGAVHIYFENLSDKYGSYKGLFLITVI